jgi:hypothetical protein
VTGETGFKGQFCAAKNPTHRCPLWVISVISKRGTDVRFTPNSDRESDMTDVRLVPLVTKCGAAKFGLFDHLVDAQQ